MYAKSQVCQCGRSSLSSTLRPTMLWTRRAHEHPRTPDNGTRASLPLDKFDGLRTARRQVSATLRRRILSGNLWHSVRRELGTQPRLRCHPDARARLGRTVEKIGCSAFVHPNYKPSRYATHNWKTYEDVPQRFCHFTPEAQGLVLTLLNGHWTLT